MATIYINGYKSTGKDIGVNLESLIIIFVHKICDTKNVKLKILLKDEVSQEPLFQVDLNGLDYEITDIESIPKITSYCIWPIVVVGPTIVAGLCSVARQIIISSENSEAAKLLGFRQACLVACNETSIWTRFCEIDMLNTVKNTLNNNDLIKDDKITFALDLVRFEYHMEQPVKIHNVYKIAREKNNDKDIKSNVPVTDLNVQHVFSEGPFMTLADAILYIYYKILSDVYGYNLFQTYFPLTNAWFYNVQLYLPEFTFMHHIKFPFETYIDDLDTIFGKVPKQSLYTVDPQRYKPQNRIYTKQSDIENSIRLIDDLTIINQMMPYGHDIEFNWSLIPLQINPLGGALPKSRANRKCDQLENVIKAILAVVNNKVSTIVDFCSGSGHLGLLLAYLLPKCHIILVENKQRSLSRARERVFDLNLSNVTLLQCNLDYFKAKFDVGVALHACGVATDLVLQNCLKNKANFVCTPCCYGGIRDCYHLKYPRSEIFKNSPLSYRDYLSLAHAADQTHDNDNVKTKQGYFCMDVIDTDRKMQAIECGYEVYLGKLLPLSCSPKNNLLVGILK